MNKIIKCQDCGKEFVLNESEQEFYKNKNFPEPKRCKTCRKTRKIKREGVKINGK